ncbi:MAG: ABC transporter ATP-binding protein [Desulfobacterium sp.]|nr:ABC transporter ATP-binding protein [Desulfobacterium sp.]MBU3950113.1 ABC transporter ATP-binding protein [Pseudomonadota bacterium]MBU4010173.1 ABC transporter ATP-binding protein [Pseudomonadota bacterium]MBU4036103.1 ABC transporter ATP-binding protein [Pseudomonadota bacterium]
MNYLLEIKNLVKKYKQVVAVDGISFSVSEGTCFGLIGPNGAGKTTTIEVIEDIIPPTSGEILYKGKPRSSSFKQEVGIQFQHTALLSSLTLRETLKIFKSLYNKSADIEEIIDICNLREIQKRINDKISGGQKQRLMLALAMINKPELMFLDEPSTGLDPQARRNLWSIIHKIKEKGKTIILTTHYMEEAQRICDEIAIMDNGKIIAQGTPNQLIKKYCEEITIILPKDSIGFSMEQIPFRYLEINGKIEIKTSDINSCLNMLISKGTDLTELIVRSPNLENVYLNLTGKQLRD